MFRRNQGAAVQELIGRIENDPEHWADPLQRPEVKAVIDLCQIDAHHKPDTISTEMHARRTDVVGVQLTDS